MARLPDTARTITHRTTMLESVKEIVAHRRTSTTPPPWA